MARHWGLSLGGGGEYVEAARKGGYIAVGWNELGSLDWLTDSGEEKAKTRNRFDSAYKKIHPGSPIQIGRGAGQLWNFVVEMTEGDIVLVRDTSRGLFHTAKITGGYVFRESPDDDCSFKHRRDVDWLKTVSRNTVSQRLKDSMGALLTIFNVGKHGPEIEGLRTGEPPTQPPRSPVTGRDAIRKGIIQRLLDLSGVEFEDFITNLLSTMGFETATTKPSGDKGVDVIGTLNAEGVATIDLRVQVKRYRHGSIGIGEILKIRGTLAPDEQGALITTSSYTKQAQKEAQETSKKPIALIDKDMLLDLVLKHFDELEPKYQSFIGLRRKEIPLEEHFELLAPGP